MPELLAEQIDGLTPEILRNWTEPWIKIKDINNMTEARIQKLCESTRQASSTIQIQEIAAEELWQKLSTLPSPDHQPSSMQNLATAEHAYNTLISLGGRPTREIEHDCGGSSCDAENWLDCHYSGEAACFNGELEKWVLFRDYQRLGRKDPPTFAQVQKYIDAFWKKHGIDNDLKPSLQIDLEMQTKVDEWKEFYFYQYRNRERKKQEVYKARQQAESLPTGDFTRAGKRWIEIANTDLKRWDDWLSWVVHQLPTVTLEHTPLFSSSRKAMSRPNRPRRSERLISRRNTACAVNNSKISKAQADSRFSRTSTRLRSSTARKQPSKTSTRRKLMR